MMYGMWLNRHRLRKQRREDMSLAILEAFGTAKGK
jgi:hypothetical protein